MDQRIHEVQQALNQVYNGSGPDHRKADRWLQQFQMTEEAWAVADSLLAMSGAELQVTFFAAITLHHKIRYDFHELPASAIPSLKATLTRHLIKWATAKDLRPAVVTRLCLSLAALAVQVNWNGAVQELSTAIMSASPPDQQGRSARVLLELMKFLPDECCNTRVAVEDNTREDFRQHLCSSTPLLLNFLGDLRGGSLGQDVIVQETIFQCLQSWVRYTEIPPEELSAHPLLPAAFDALSNSDLFEASIDLLIEVLRTYSRPEQSMPIVQLVVPRTMELQPAYVRSVQEEDEDVARGLCRLFTELGEAYMDLLMWQQDLGQLALAEIMLLCTGHPNHEIATIPLHFWYAFCRSLDRLDPPDLKQAKLDVFSPCLTRLVGVLLRLMCYPEDVDQRTEDQVDDLKRHRYDVSDVLNDCSRVLGGVTILGLVLQQLEQELASFMSQSQDTQATSWHMVEACLFGVRSVARGVPHDENNVMPHVMAMLLRLPPTNFHIRYTANLVVGRYSEWLKRHPAELPAMFQFLLGGFGTPECAAAASTAIKDVCESCAVHMGQPALALYDQLQASKGGMQFKDELEILQGLCHVISTLPMDMATAALHRMVQPVAEALSAGANDTVKATVQELERLTVMVQYVNPKLQPSEIHPVVGVMKGVWPLLGAIVPRHPASSSLAEKLCRCYKHAIKSCRGQFEPLLDPLLVQLVTNFSVAPHSSFLYCASVCAATFGGDPNHRHTLFRALTDLSRTVSSHLSGGFDQLTANPDMVEEYFYLVGRYLKNCPALLLVDPLLDSVVKLSIVGLRLQHREAHRGVLAFLDEFVGVGTNSAEPAYKVPIEGLLRENGAAIVRGLIGCIVGELPSYALDDRNQGTPCVASVLWKLSLLCVNWLREWITAALMDVPEGTATASQKQQFCAELLDGGPTKSQVQGAVQMLSHRCWQNSQRWNST